MEKPEQGLIDRVDASGHIPLAYAEPARFDKARSILHKGGGQRGSDPAGAFGKGPDEE